MRRIASVLLFIILTTLACAAAGNLPSMPALPAVQSALAEVKSWLYLIDVNLADETVAQIAASNYDVVVLDFIPSEANNTNYPMAEVIDQLHSAPHPKLVLAYIDIGQAENYRTYWQSDWGIGNPEWIVSGDPDGWEGNYPVAYWHDEWREIWLGRGGILQSITDSGFDGVYLDWVEAYSDESVIAAAEANDVDPRQEMIWWVSDIAEFGRDRAPNFIVIAQNAAELARNDEYIEIIDAIAQEQVWFDGGADNEPPGDCPLPRTDADVDTKTYYNSLSPECQHQYDEFPESTLHVSSEEYLRDLTLAQEKDLTIFTVDYALDEENTDWVYETSRAYGFIPFVGNRALDRYIEPNVTVPSLQAAPSAITHVWANEGSDKVTQGELRASDAPTSVLNSVWDGEIIALFGARNEVVAFNLVLEAPEAKAAGVEVSLTELISPEGTAISSCSASGDDLFNYVGRNIELFYVRYLEIRGLSTLVYENYDERHIPERCRRPYDESGFGSGGWEERPCHNQFYPDIAVPLELESPFEIAPGTNQSIWVDIYIPKDTPAGIYNGTITLREGGTPTQEIPVSLDVRDFTLPDLPSARTMIYFSFENINERYLGTENIYPDPGTEVYAQAQLLANRHFQLAHRHKLSLIDNYIPPEQMDETWLVRLNGELFTAERGYAGVGEGVGNNVYSIGTYGSWPWMGEGQAAMWNHSDAWVNWFDAHPFDTPTDYFLYLIDESDDYAQTEEWANWMDANPGPGGRLPSLATIDLPGAAAHVPALDIPTSTLLVGENETWASAAKDYVNDPNKRFYYYNGGRPGSGTFAIEDDGVALRVSAWAQHKMSVDRWFYWESTYYLNYQCYGDDDEAHTNIFQQAQTFGCYEEDDPVLGQTGWNYTNGDGLLFYPGVDTRFPEESYNIMGPFASLRLKLMRRGVQDADYLTLAAAVDPIRTAEIVSEMIPKVLWEYGVSDPSDPTWVYTDISWPTDPDAWEAARIELAEIIENGQK